MLISKLVEHCDEMLIVNDFAAESLVVKVDPHPLAVFPWLHTLMRISSELGFQSMPKILFSLLGAPIIVTITILPHYPGWVTLE
jgi:hypothetical protein